MDLEAFDGGRDRSKQSDAGVIGVSDLHTCREKVRRTLLGMVATDVPEKWAAIVGTYVDEGVKQRGKLAARGYSTTSPQGHAPQRARPARSRRRDRPARRRPSSTTRRKTSWRIRRLGADEHARAQRHLYYLGAYQAGLVPAEGIVRNIFLDRSGSDPHPHVEQEPFDMDVVLRAQAWYEGPVYAAEHGEEAMKEWPRSKCERYCQFFTACRGGEPVDEEYLTGHRAAILAELVAAKTTEKQAAALKDAARNELLGVTGRSDTHWVRSTVTNGKTASTRLDAGLIEEGAA
jgi:hypothetical protein